MAFHSLPLTLGCGGMSRHNRSMTNSTPTILIWLNQYKKYQQLIEQGLSDEALDLKREIDEALLNHPSILEAAAFAVPCNDYGERVEACVLLKEKVSVELDELKSFCENQIGKFKSPDNIHIVAELPKGPSGKVQRLKLLELIYENQNQQ